MYRKNTYYIKKSLLILLLLSFVLRFYGQTIKLNSDLIENPKTYKVDIDVMKKYIPEFTRLYTINIDSSINKIHSLLLNKDILSNQYLKSIAQVVSGDLHKIKGEYSDANIFYFSALSYFDKIGDISNSIRILTSIGELCRASESYSKSIYYLSLAEHKANQSSIKEYLPAIQSRFAAVYFELIFTDTTNIENITLRKIYTKNNNIQSAINIWKSLLFINTNYSLEAATLTHDTSLIIENLNLLGGYYHLNKNYIKCIPIYTDALELINKFPHSKDKSLVLSSLSKTYLKMGDLVNAEKYGEESYIEAMNAGINVYKWLALIALEELNYGKGDYKKAFEYSNEKNTVFVNLINEKSHKQINELQEKYEVNKKESEINTYKIEKAKEYEFRVYIIVFSALALLLSILLIIIIYLRFQNAIQKRLIAEEEKKYKEDLLQKSEALIKTRDEFFANISHEIRTPLNSILGFSEILNEKLSGTEYEQYLTSINSSGKNLLVLMNDIMDLSKLEAGKFVLLYQKIDITKLCKEILNLYSIKANVKGIGLKINSELTHKNYIIDEVRMRQVLLNLVGNSMKYTVDGNIEIVLQNKPANDLEDEICIKIIDTGIGIPKEQMENLFKPFHQYSEMHSRVFGGTGLGLAICKKLIELMNGDIAVESETGKGTIFTITFKNIKRYISDPANEPEPEETKWTNISFRKSKILIVEDNKSNREIAKTFLQSYDFEIMEAENGAIAIEMLKDFIPDIIFMDIMMPVMDGIEAVKIIKKNPATATIPVIALTAKPMSAKEDMISEYFDGVIYKPINRKNLVKELMKFIPIEEFENIKTDNSNYIIVSEESLKYIKNTLLPKWKEITILLSNDEMEEFADAVNKFASVNNIEILISWSQTIINYSRTFNIKLLYEEFNKFPAIVNQLRITN